MKFTRRTLLRSGALAIATPALNALPAALSAAQAQAADRKWLHGLSLFGDLKYPAGFKHFEYVNPAAPKGGVVRLSAIGTYDNFNPVVVVKGVLAAGASSLIYDRLMARALDEVSSEYGQLADGVSFPDDFSRVSYRLRPEAKWHDDRPVTVEDVIFSLEVQKQHNPRMAAYYRHVVKAEKSGDREITFVFDGPGNRELPQIVGQFPVLPKHWWEGKDASGQTRDISKTTLEPPLGSGPYRIKDFVPGRSVAYERVANYWGRDLNVGLGSNNFGEFRFEYFRDTTVALEAFKGDNFDWRTENQAKNWATAYDFPAVRNKRVILEEFEIQDRGIMQAFAFNTRRDKFKDARVRQAFNHVLDFEEMNKQFFFGRYTRIASYFDGTELAARDLPQGLELEILQSVKGKVPEDLFTTPYRNPVNGDREAVRNNFREAIRLMKEAGYDLRDGKLLNARTGERFAVEFLGATPDSERFALFYKVSLERLGIEVLVRTIDPAQYENRVRNWDFDIITDSWPQSLSPGNEQRGHWGSAAADQPGSDNTIGIKNEAVDAMIERVIFARSREELVAATRALDRVLLWNHYVVPQWTYNKQRTARWDRFGRPAILPKYAAAGFPTVWWWDAEKAAKTGNRS